MKFDLPFHSLLLNAAGSLGFTPNPHGPVDLGRLGSFITNPISLRPRSPAKSARFLPYPGGVLLHSGHPNPGLNASIQRYGPSWARAPLPVLVHLLAEGVEEITRAVTRLEEVEGVAGIELRLPPDYSQDEARQILQAAEGELPLLIQVLPDQVQALGSVLSEAEASAISLGPPRGTLPDGARKLVTGRLYGPALLPLTLEAVRRLTDLHLPVVAGGGIFSTNDVKAAISAGAIAVQLDIRIWQNPESLPTVEEVSSSR